MHFKGLAKRNSDYLLNNPQINHDNDNTFFERQETKKVQIVHDSMIGKSYPSPCII